MIADYLALPEAIFFMKYWHYWAAILAVYVLIKIGDALWK